MCYLPAFFPWTTLGNRFPSSTFTNRTVCAIFYRPSPPVLPSERFITHVSNHPPCRNRCRTCRLRRIDCTGFRGRSTHFGSLGSAEPSGLHPAPQRLPKPPRTAGESRSPTRRIRRLRMRPTVSSTRTAHSNSKSPTSRTAPCRTTRLEASSSPTRLPKEIGFSERAVTTSAAFQLRLTGTTNPDDNGFTTLVWVPSPELAPAIRDGRCGQAREHPGRTLVEHPHHRRCSQGRAHLTRCHRGSQPRCEGRALRRERRHRLGSLERLRRRREVQRLHHQLRREDPA